MELRHVEWVRPRCGTDPICRLQRAQGLKGSQRSQGKHFAVGGVLAGLNCYQFGCRRRLQRRGLACTKAYCDIPAETKVFFCILARGSNSKDAWPKSPRGASELGNTRDDIARSLMAALIKHPNNISGSNSAVVLVFEDTRRTQSKMWWVLQQDFLEDMPVVTEYTVLRRCQLLAEFMHAQDS
eukprot:symbB.v1.2.005101.t1/scaffold234.1/size257806/20